MNTTRRQQLRQRTLLRCGQLECPTRPRRCQRDLRVRAGPTPSCYSRSSRPALHGPRGCRRMRPTLVTTHAEKIAAGSAGSRCLLGLVPPDPEILVACVLMHSLGSVLRNDDRLKEAVIVGRGAAYLPRDAQVESAGCHRNSGGELDGTWREVHGGCIGVVRGAEREFEPRSARERESRRSRTCRVAGPAAPYNSPASRSRVV